MWEYGLDNGPIILLATSSLRSLSSMALGFTRADLWLDLECNVLEDVSRAIAGMWVSSLSLKPSVNPLTRYCVLCGI